MAVVEREVVVEGAGVGGRGGKQAVPCSIGLQDRASGISRHQPLKHVEREHRRGGVCDRRRIGDPDLIGRHDRERSRRRARGGSGRRYGSPGVRHAVSSKRTAAPARTQRARRIFLCSRGAP